MATTSSKDTWAIVMMAGMGTRMKSDQVKVLHDICGQPMAKWVLDSCDRAGLTNRVIVVGHQAGKLMEKFPGETFAVQEPQKGTGHAVMVGMEKVPLDAKNIVILSGDVPCLDTITIEAMIAYHAENDIAATILSFFPPDPCGYGRIIRDSGDAVLSIVEDKDLKGDQREIEECNSGIYVFDRAKLGNSLAKMEPSERSGEYHLPDAVLNMIESRGVGSVHAVAVDEWMEAMGVNSRVELAEATDFLRWRICEAHMASGVTIVDPPSTWIGPDAKLGRDSVIHPGCIIMGATEIGEGCSIGPYTELQSVIVARNCRIMHSVLEECRIDDDVKIGPYAHIRPGTRIREGARVGNFVEMKKTDFGERSKSGHLTYLGDTVVGKDVNVGAGTITCNFDGESKNVTEIEDGVFVGSDTILVAPIRIGHDAYTAAGSTLTKDVPPFALAFGRARQTVKDDWVKKRKMKKKDINDD